MVDTSRIMRSFKKVSSCMDMMNSLLSSMLLELNEDCKTVEEVHLKFSPEYLKHRSAYQNEPQMNWTDVKRKGLKVIDKGHCFVTETGVGIDWSSFDAYQAQTWLLSQSKKNEVAAESLTTIDILNKCSIDGMVVKLPALKLSKKQYDDVKLALNKADGFWKGGKIQGFVFEENPSVILKNLCAGAKINIKKEFQFFATPDGLGDEMVALLNIRATDRLCEPSAGDGALIKAVRRVFPDMSVSCYELMPKNQQKLIKLSDVIMLGGDFLKHNVFFDAFIANPPFANHKDVDHILHMYSCLSKKGRIVTLASTKWRTASDKKAAAFREFIKKVKAKVVSVPAGTFKESGTNVESVIIVIKK